jgi:uncharacterized protein (TIGR02594 family)
MATPKTKGELQAMSDPAWLAEAFKYLGEKEIKGPHHNPHILKWWKDLGEPYRDDETAWCGAFVGGAFRAVGLPTVKGAAGARNWTKLKVKLDRPAYGCVVVFWRGDRDGWAGHVGFVVGRDARGNLMVLGGNQGDMVSIKPFEPATVPGNRVLGYYWPGIYPYEERFNLPLLKSDGKLSTNEA